MVLSAQETRAAESLLADAWGPGVEVLIAEKIWNRSYVLRLSLTGGRLSGAGPPRCSAGSPA
jgi:hypothetical protein